jgi:hypothetical protein
VGPQAALNPRDLGPHLHAELGVEVREGLVHQEGLGAANDRAAHRHPLALTSRKVRGLALEIGLEVQNPGGLAHLAVDLCVLEHHRDVTVARCLVIDDLAADPQLAFGDVLEPADHPQSGGLAGSGRADQDHEFPVSDVEVHVLHGFEAVRGSAW